MKDLRHESNGNESANASSLPLDSIDQDKINQEIERLVNFNPTLILPVLSLARSILVKTPFSAPCRGSYACDIRGHKVGLHDSRAVSYDLAAAIYLSSEQTNPTEGQREYLFSQTWLFVRRSFPSSIEVKDSKFVAWLDTKDMTWHLALIDAMVEWITHQECKEIIDVTNPDKTVKEFMRDILKPVSSSPKTPKKATSEASLPIAKIIEEYV